MILAVQLHVYNLSAPEDGQPGLDPAVRGPGLAVEARHCLHSPGIGVEAGQDHLRPGLAVHGGQDHHSKSALKQRQD